MNNINDGFKLCYVKFLDTKLTEQVWQARRRADKKSGLATCEAGGFLLSDEGDKVKITIAHGEGNVLDVLSIPKSCILSFTIIPEDVYNKTI